MRSRIERAVRDQGNFYAQKLIEEVFETVPIGAAMVSDEGACASYYRYRKELTE